MQEIAILVTRTSLKDISKPGYRIKSYCVIFHIPDGYDFCFVDTDWRQAPESFQVFCLNVALEITTWRQNMYCPI